MYHILLTILKRKTFEISWSMLTTIWNIIAQQLSTISEKLVKRIRRKKDLKMTNKCSINIESTKIKNQNEMQNSNSWTQSTRDKFTKSYFEIIRMASRQKAVRIFPDLRIHCRLQNNKEAEQPKTTISIDFPRWKNDEGPMMYLRIQRPLLVLTQIFMHVSTPDIKRAWMQTKVFFFFKIFKKE